MEKPPLYYWTARIMCSVFGSLLPLHDAARLTSVFYTIITTFFLWKTAVTLFHDYKERIAIAYTAAALFLGNYGTALFSHSLITDVALTAGASVTLYGAALLYKMQEKWKSAGIWLGIGFGTMFLSKGLVMPAVFGISWMIILLLSSDIRNRTNIRTISLAVVVSLPFLVIWPALLYQHSPSLFMEWFWDNNVGRFLGFSVRKLGAENKRCNFLVTLFVSSFPIFPLACVAAVSGRKNWRKIEYCLPMTISLIGIVVLFTSASFRSIYIMPLFPLFSILGVQGLMSLSEWFLIPWNRLVRTLFTLAIISTWIIWCNLRYSPPPHLLPWLAHLFNNVLPSGFTFHNQQYAALVIASVVTFCWFASLNVKGNSAFNTALIFMLGAIAMWCTSHTLLLPWINEAKSYRTTVRELDEYVRKSPDSGRCIANYRLGENFGPMVEYFMGKNEPLPLASDLGTSSCPLVLGPDGEDPRLDKYPGWKQVWNNKDLHLYERVN